MSSLVSSYNLLPNSFNKAYIENYSVLGIDYDSIKKSLSLFEELEYNDKLAVLQEMFIRLENNTLLSNYYEKLSLPINGYELSTLIGTLKTN